MKAFTLIEIIIATTILAVGIVTVLVMFPLGIKVAKSGQRTTIATYLAQAKTEEAITQSYSQLLASETTEDYGEIPEFESYKRVTKINCVRSDTLAVADCDYDLTNDPSPMKEIEVLVSWHPLFGGLEKNIVLKSLVAKR